MNNLLIVLVLCVLGLCMVCALCGLAACMLSAQISHNEERIKGEYNG